MYSGLLGKRRSVSGAAVDPAQSRMVLAGDALANCVGCRHCAMFMGSCGPELSYPPEHRLMCLAQDPPRQLGAWMTLRPDWCPVADRDDAIADAREEQDSPLTDEDRQRAGLDLADPGLAGGQGREPAETTAAADALQIAGLVGFMVFVCWCLTSCGDIGRLVR